MNHVIVCEHLAPWKTTRLMKLRWLISFVQLRVLSSFSCNRKGHEVTRRIGAYALVAYGLAGVAHTQARPLPGTDVPQIYNRLLPQIEKIPAFDHHAHPGFFDDADVDAMAAPPGSAALRERDTNPELVAAAKALFGYPYNDLSPEHAKWLVQKKAELKKSRGNQYFSDLLDKLNIERGVANRNDSHGSSSQIRSCGRLTTNVKQRAIPTNRFTFLCRKKCCTAGCSRRVLASSPQNSTTTLPS